MATLHLAGGRGVEVRPLGPGDGDQLMRLFHRLSPDTVHRRFLSPVHHPDARLAARLLDIDHADREALAAVVDGEVVAVARYAREAPDCADLAVVVQDSWQRRGLGIALLRRLAAVARRRGITRFHAVMLGDNRGAVGMLRSFSRSARFRFEGGELEAEVPLEAATWVAPPSPRADREL